MYIDVHLDKPKACMGVLGKALERNGLKLQCLIHLKLRSLEACPVLGSIQRAVGVRSGLFMAW